MDTKDEIILSKKDFEKQVNDWLKAHDALTLDDLNDEQTAELIWAMMDYTEAVKEKTGGVVTGGGSPPS